MSEETSPTPEGEENSKSNEAPAMNRAERRAAAKGKPTGSGAGRGGANSPSTHSGRPSGIAGQMRLPRTGHKGG